MIEPGIYALLSSADYHADKNSISRSALMDFKKNPYKYWAKHLNPNKPQAESKVSWDFGTAFHTLILEPHLFDEQFVIKPEPKLLKEVGREEYDRIQALREAADSSGKKVLSKNLLANLIEMKNSLRTNEKACALLEEALIECSYFWKDEHSGLMVKSRPDALWGNIYIDIKTIEDASPENYQREMAKYGYHIQAAMVKEAVRALEEKELKACINICVEKTYPYSVGIYIIDEFAIEAGHLEFKQLLLDLKAAIGHNKFDDYGVQTIGLPRWAL